MWMSGIGGFGREVVAGFSSLPDALDESSHVLDVAVFSDDGVVGHVGRIATSRNLRNLVRIANTLERAFSFVRISGSAAQRRTKR